MMVGAWPAKAILLGNKTCDRQKRKIDRDEEVSDGSGKSEDQ
jgi:hypothetical protein